MLLIIYIPYFIAKSVERKEQGIQSTRKTKKKGKKDKKKHDDAEVKNWNEHVSSIQISHDNYSIYYHIFKLAWTKRKKKKKTLFVEFWNEMHTVINSYRIKKNFVSKKHTP